jgi:HAD superfamily hydrolase (TIGR01484 family)
MKIRALATDYDGTIALHGVVEPATIESIEKLKDSGRKAILVTGREIPDLLGTFSEPAIFDLIVAENGALLYWPLTKAERVLAPAPPPQFSKLLRERAVNALSVGRVIVATTDSYENIVRETIEELQLDLDLILNKGSVMVLPRGVDKGTGLKVALEVLDLSPSETVAVGDAENDQSFFRAAGFGVAVANALPLLKEQAAWTTPSDHGCGVRELITRILSTDDIGVPAVPLLY